MSYAENYSLKIKFQFSLTQLNNVPKKILRTHYELS